MNKILRELITINKSYTDLYNECELIFNREGYLEITRYCISNNIKYDKENFDINLIDVLNNYKNKLNNNKHDSENKLRRFLNKEYLKINKILTEMLPENINKNKNKIEFIVRYLDEFKKNPLKTIVIQKYNTSENLYTYYVDLNLDNIKNMINELLEIYDNKNTLKIYSK